MKYRQKDVFIKNAEGPQVQTFEHADGSARVLLEFATDSIRGDVKTTTWHHIRFELDYDEVACIGRTLAACLLDMRTVFNDRIDNATESVRRQLG
jgi:hypothetical protein